MKETEVITHVFYATKDSDGQEPEIHEIETTLNHRFWSEGEWKSAGTLKAGDLLTLADGTQVEVTEVTFEDRHETVYNMEVADYHTYYVGEDGVWVHNRYGKQGTGIEGDSSSKKVTSRNQMQGQVEAGKAPREIDRVDPPHNSNQQPHIHFGDNEAALNIDGTWHDDGKKIPSITNKIKMDIRKWLEFTSRIGVGIIWNGK